jgi:hypothetical protein
VPLDSELINKLRRRSMEATLAFVLVAEPAGAVPRNGACYAGHEAHSGARSRACCARLGRLQVRRLMPWLVRGCRPCSLTAASCEQQQDAACMYAGVSVLATGNDALLV